MGTFKGMKDMKEVEEASPDMVRQAKQLGAQAQEYAAAQQAAMQMQTVPYATPVAPTATAPAPVASEPDLEPIAGVTIRLYAEISKGLAAYNYDITKGPEVAASKGVSAEDWDAAVAGWNERIKANRAVAQRFNALYMGRA